MEKKWNFKKHKRQVAELPTLEVHEVQAFIFESAEHPDATVRKLASHTIQKNFNVVKQWLRTLKD